MDVFSQLPRRISLSRTERRLHAKWRKDGFTTPLPTDAKRSVLSRYGLHGGTWVETGTYLGDTTAFLAGFADRVITLEPAKEIFDRASARFADNSRVEVLNTSSEEAFAELIPSLSGDVSFWLDGHYSGGPTFQGGLDCPLKVELAEIAKNLKRFANVAVLVDDIRLCGPAANTDYSGYPTLDELVDWARDNKLKWLIEHDIFVARNSF